MTDSETNKKKNLRYSIFISYSHFRIIRMEFYHIRNTLVSIEEYLIIKPVETWKNEIKQANYAFSIITL